MHGKAKNVAVPFVKMPDGVFFLVESPDSPYAGKHMISIFDARLPESLREGNDMSALFLLSYVEPVPRSPTKIVVTEVDHDISDDAQVVQMSPVPRAPNGAHLFERDAERPSRKVPFIKMGKIDDSGVHWLHNKHRGRRGRGKKKRA